MDISALALLGQATPVGAPTTSVVEPQKGFAAALGVVQSGAPPGPEPPPTGAKVGEGVTIIGPNAQSIIPDFLPQSKTDEVASSATQQEVPSEKTDKKSTTPSAEALLLFSASLNAAAFATPTLIQPGTVKTGPMQGSSVIIQPGTIKTPATQAITKQDSPAPAELLPTEGQTQIETPPPPPVALHRGVQNEKPVPEAMAYGNGNGFRSMGEGTKSVPKPAAKLPEASSDSPPAMSFDHKPITDQDSVVQITKEASPPNATNVNTDIDKSPGPIVVEKIVAASGPAQEVGVPSDQAQPKPGVTEKPAKAAKPDARQGVTAVATDDNKVDTKPIKGKANVTEVDGLKSSTAKTEAPKPEPAAIQPKTTADTQAVEPKADALPKRDLNLVVRQISDRIELLAATRPKNGVVVQLQPAHLGSITLTVKSLAGAVEAHITASNDNVRTALEQNRSLLGQSMEQRGLKLDSVQIASQTQTASNSTNRQASQQQQQQAQQAHSHRHTPTTSGGQVPVSVQQARMTTKSIDGVDLWI